ncbi:metallophosphoesterase [Desulfofarcimen acetoxidans DSM 771]|jgi:DNA repair exonuclease SbcCD nuclease subunit|uniref:Metallophosphoesterase n=1 Tax=Desulfofarcimen acetoxidans (strain ATCC 49208 / DSM 771 / KCTC 5769 / VKM B-1644 / 5575) TaxID=485916 RepID=C8W6H7_DESAS|nr:metallophosphoesterase [Desulfofarcimen acetoxidans]ACV62266.1 metallophosphoesterase [Desulfofarcimen acetoxidans DSM 771]
MKFLYMTDTHIRGNSPQGRLDNFPETLARKLSEVVQLANRLEVAALLHGGDLFDTPNPTLAVTGIFTDILKQCRAPVIAVAGNHDLFAYNPATLGRTMLGFLARLGLLKLLQPGERLYFKSPNLTVQLTGQHFHAELDREEPRRGYLTDKKDCDLAVHMVHGMLLQKNIFPGALYTLIEHIAPHTQADFTLCGHAHLGFADTKINERYFINPGAMVRLSAMPEEISRRPQVVLLDFSSAAAKYSKIPLQSALPGEQVLDRSHIDAKVFQEEKLAAFVQSIKAAGEYEISDINDIVNNIAVSKKLPDEVREEALKRLAAVQETLS